MTLTEKINEELKTAMKSKDEAGLRGLRAIKSALILLKTDKGANVDNEEEEMKMLQKLAKQRKESIEIYKTQNRSDLALAEEQELAIIEKFLPKQMDEDEIRAVIANLIKENGLEGAAAVSKLMPIAIKELAGKADNKTVSAIARELLS